MDDPGHGSPPIEKTRASPDSFHCFAHISRGQTGENLGGLQRARDGGAGGERQELRPNLGGCLLSSVEAPELLPDFNTILGSE